MLYHLVSDDAFLDLSILQEKATAALRYIENETNSPRVQTLADIASDYISAMDNIIEAMQKSPVHCSPVTST